MRQGILALREPHGAGRGGHGRLCRPVWMAQSAVPGEWEPLAGAGGRDGAAPLGSMALAWRASGGLGERHCSLLCNDAGRDARTEPLTTHWEAATDK